MPTPKKTSKVTSAFDLDTANEYGNTDTLKHLTSIDDNVKGVLTSLTTPEIAEEDDIKVSEEDEKNPVQKLLDSLQKLLYGEEVEKKEEEKKEDKDILFFRKLDLWVVKLDDILNKKISPQEVTQANKKQEALPLSQGTLQENTKILSPTDVKPDVKSQESTITPTINTPQILSTTQPVQRTPPTTQEMPSTKVSGEARHLGGTTKSERIEVADRPGEKSERIIENPSSARIEIISNSDLQKFENREFSNILREIPVFKEGTSPSNLSSAETYIQNLSISPPDKTGVIPNQDNLTHITKDYSSVLDKSHENITKDSFKEVNSSENSYFNSSNSSSRDTVTNQSNQSNHETINVSDLRENVKISQYHEGTNFTSALEKAYEKVDTIEKTYQEVDSKTAEYINTLLSSQSDISKFVDGTSTVSYTDVKDKTTDKDFRAEIHDNVMSFHEGTTSSNFTKDTSAEYHVNNIIKSDNSKSSSERNILSPNSPNYMNVSYPSTSSVNIPSYYGGSGDTISSMLSQTSDTSSATFNSFVTPDVSIANMGGMTTEKMFIVGDQKGLDPTSPSDKTSELVFNPTGAPLSVKSNSETKDFLGGMLPKFAGGTSPFSEASSALAASGAVPGITSGGLGADPTSVISGVGQLSTLLGASENLATGFIGLNTVISQTITGFNSLAEAIGPFSPEITGAQTRIEIEQIKRAQNIAGDSGGDLAKLYESSNILWLDIQKILYDISRPFIIILIPTIELLGSFVKTVGGLIEFFSDSLNIITSFFGSLFSFDLGKIGETLSEKFNTLLEHLDKNLSDENTSIKTDLTSGFGANIGIGFTALT